MFHTPAHKALAVRPTQIAAPASAAIERPAAPPTALEALVALRAEVSEMESRCGWAGNGARAKADAAIAAASQAAQDAYIVVQEGGSSEELYLHAHYTENEAHEDRIACRDDGSYRTSSVVKVPAILAAHGEVFYETVEAILKAALDVDFPED